MKIVEKILLNIINIIIAISLTIVVVIVTGNTLLRYIFNSGINGSEEISRYFFIWIVFLSSVIAYKNKKHLALELPYSKFPIIIQKIIFIIGRLTILFLVVLITYGGFQLTILNMNSHSPALHIPLILFYSSLIIIGLGIAILVLFELYKSIFDPDYVTNEFSSEAENEGSENG